MVLDPLTKIRKVRGIASYQEDEIKRFMQGAIYAWSKNYPGLPFAVYDLMGGKNYRWEGTPLIALFQKHTSQGKNDQEAIRAAGRDLGWIVKRVVCNDKRRYLIGKKRGKSGLVASYLWDGIEPYDDTPLSR